ncbi:MAG: yddM [Herbinix sp.]|jgi:hypothetical protein|nr:yddM [Herbinix sp.]
MDKSNWGVKIFEVLITVLITSLMSLALQFILSFNQCNVSIGTSIVSNNKIMTPITIKNNSSNKAIKDIEVSVAQYNQILDGITSLTYQINQTNNNMIINYIPPNETISLILITKNILDLEDVKIVYDGRINTTYLEKKSITYVLIITQAIIYGLMFLASQYLIDKKIIKFKNELIESKEEIKRQDKKLEENERAQENLLKRCDNLVKESHKTRIYYITRMKSYSKELDFWKDTIRKLLYQSNEQKVSESLIFDMVTKTLKTYGTRNKIDSNYEEITYLAEIMSKQDTKV